MMARGAVRKGPRGGLSAKPISSVNHRHEQLVNWLILNPGKSLKECAQEMKYTPCSLSRIIHSDMFQEVYRTRCQEVGAIASHTIVAQLRGLTSLVLEKAEELLQKPEPDPRFVGDTLRTTLGALGYGPSNGGGDSKHLHVHLTPQDLQDARAKAAQKAIECQPAP